MVENMESIAARYDKIKSLTNFDLDNKPVLILTNPKFDSGNPLVTLQEDINERNMVLVKQRPC